MSDSLDSLVFFYWNCMKLTFTHYTTYVHIYWTHIHSKLHAHRTHSQHTHNTHFIANVWAKVKYWIVTKRLIHIQFTAEKYWNALFTQWKNRIAMMCAKFIHSTHITHFVQKAWLTTFALRSHYVQNPIPTHVKYTFHTHFKHIS